jgi:uncharacterized protein YgiM (DUF1202 family)
MKIATKCLVLTAMLVVISLPFLNAFFADQEMVFPTRTPLVTAPQSPTPSTSTSFPKCTVTAEGLNVRERPGIDSSVIDWLHRGDIVTILQDPPANAWIEVEARERTGWINSTYCERTETQ